MLHYIKGRVTGSFENGIVVENNGLGYEINVPSSSVFYLAKEDDTVTVFTAMIVREDDVSLYGFDDRDSLKLFRLLMSVSGIGAKAALSILSALTAAQVKSAIVFNDPDSLAKAQGVGKKTAQRVVLELKDKIDAAGISASMPEGIADGQISMAESSMTEIAEAVDALVSLGYSKSEASDAVAAAGITGGTTQQYVKAALKKLSKF